MLEIHGLHVEVEGKEVLHGVDMSFELGKNYCLLGKNGSGKSSLALTVMGHPHYNVTAGNITMTNPAKAGQVTNDHITAMSPHERAKL